MTSIWLQAHDIGKEGFCYETSLSVIRSNCMCARCACLDEYSIILYHHYFFKKIPGKWFFNAFLFFLRSSYGSTDFKILLKLQIIKDNTRGNSCPQAEFWNAEYKLVENSLELWKSLNIPPTKKSKVFQNIQYLSHSKNNDTIVIVWAYWSLPN